MLLSYPPWELSKWLSWILHLEYLLIWLPISCDLNATRVSISNHLKCSDKKDVIVCYEAVDFLDMWLKFHDHNAFSNMFYNNPCCDFFL